MLLLEGRLADEGVRELEKVVSGLGRDLRRMALDLSGLTFVDARGVRMLRSLQSRGARLAGTSAYVATLMAGSRT